LVIDASLLSTQHFKMEEQWLFRPEFGYWMCSGGVSSLPADCCLDWLLVVFKMSSWHYYSRNQDDKTLQCNPQLYCFVQHRYFVPDFKMLAHRGNSLRESGFDVRRDMNPKLHSTKIASICNPYLWSGSFSSCVCSRVEAWCPRILWALPSIYHNVLTIIITCF
jgi:hypothetical protein